MSSESEDSRDSGEMSQEEALQCNETFQTSEESSDENFTTGNKNEAVNKEKHGRPMRPSSASSDELRSPQAHRTAKPEGKRSTTAGKKLGTLDGKGVSKQSDLLSASSDSELDEDEEAEIAEELLEHVASQMKVEKNSDGNEEYVFDINSDSRSGSDDEQDDEAGELVMEQVRKLLLRRDGKHNAARLQWLQYERKQKEAEEEAKQFEAYWERRHQEDKDLWRNKDFANAVDKMSRAGYKGKHGNFEVPEETILEFNALYMQITVGDYDGNESLKCAEEWKKLQGKTRIDCQREFIKKTNKTITRFGWNPPRGWR